LIRRDRLFAAMDEGLHGKLVWITGPGGAGKTSLLSTYLEARSTACVWYQLGAVDADLAVFFQYLRQAARAHGKGEALPAFSPAHLPELERFALQFFEVFFARLEQPVVIAFDNYQDIPLGARVHEAIAAMLKFSPAETRFVVLSRGEPHPAFARWVASPDFTQIGWDELRFAGEESAQLAAKWGLSEPAPVDSLAELSRGWAAGMVLMLRAARGGMHLTRSIEGPQRALFGYFASEIFAGLDATIRRFLQQTAVLPAMSPAMAEALTGTPRAARILAELNEQNFFTERKAGHDLVYEYHPLFREFLLARAADDLGDAALEDVKRRAAPLLEAAGQLEGAAQLMKESKDWTALDGFIQRHAEHMTGRALFQTLARWIDLMPRELMERSPWLALWKGVCQVSARDAAYKQSLEAAMSLFDRADDIAGSIVVRAWLARLSRSNEELAGWLRGIEELVDRRPAFLGSELEAQVIARLAQLRLDVRFPARHRLLMHWIDRAAALARAPGNIRERARLAAFASSGYTFHGDLVRLREMVAEFPSLLSEPELGPRERLQLLIVVGFCDLYTGTEHQDLLAQLSELLDATGFVIDQASVCNLLVRRAVSRGNVATARDLVERLEAMTRFSMSARSLSLASSVNLKLMCGDAKGALAQATELIEWLPRNAMMRSYALAWIGESLIEKGAYREAVRSLEEGVARAREHGNLLHLFADLVLLAVAERRLDQQEPALAALREGLSLARRIDIVPLSFPVGNRLLAEALEFALANGVETEYARKAVRTRRLVAPAPESDHWPWPVRIRTLGGFALETAAAVSGEDAKGKKKPQRPMELLQYLIAQGGAAVAIGKASEALWPDADGDAAKKAFDVTLYRLRKLLGSDEIAVIEGGKLSLNTILCWVDCIAFAGLVSKLESVAATQVSELVDRAVELYRGHFLAGDDPPAWAIPHREKLRGLLHRLVETGGERLEQANASGAAERLYRRAVELDPLAESAYRRLMRMLAARGESAEALQIYRRCRQTLSIMLGVNPSAETEALHRSVADA
jgi:LuxR family transcriptional regulator, maltose regulon positive regulatory protein